MSKNLHICTLGPFIPPFFNFVRGEFSQTSNSFYIFGDLKKYPIEVDRNVFVHKNGKLGYLKLLLKLYSADKIIIHGLFDVYLLLILIANPWLLKKCYWVIWGADLYSFMYPKDNIKYKITEKLKQIAIRKIGYLLTYIQGDVSIAREQYGAKGEYLETIGYLSNVVTLRDIENKNKNVVNILIGNSADPTNEHLEVLDKLSFLKYHNIKIIVPLSYGNKEYAQKVINYGSLIYGDKFWGVTDFMPYIEYLSLLENVDIAIFNHKRQQAMGNTINLIGLGKTVYLRKSTTQWDFFKKLSIDVLDIDTFDLNNKVNSKANRANVSDYFSKQNLIKQWSNILKE
ncbi:TDP-N-acetylfucosamine:lipid II N-acetylfucosaminyltransferase [Acinetobacter guillouiae]|uniref:TDP-N-acetylfucosamine:lipid II N-acetylfucosaminyltransferase n=1 Tax=Acinetobacter guillouiae TaxID=106649 RepID=UPI003AF8DA95